MIVLLGEIRDGCVVVFVGVLVAVFVVEVVGVLVVPVGAAGRGFTVSDPPEVAGLSVVVLVALDV